MNTTIDNDKHVDHLGDEELTFLCDNCSRLAMTSWIVFVTTKGHKKKTLCVCSPECKKNIISKSVPGTYED